MKPAAEFVRCTGDEAARLVEHDVHARGLIDADVIHDDDVLFQYYRELGILPHGEVHLHLAHADQLRGTAARAEAELGHGAG